MLTYRVYRTSTFISGNRPENELSYFALKERVDEAASIENWYIDFSSLEDVMNFMKEHGKIIIKPPTYKGTVGDIEIYDCKREDLFLDAIIN